jgi:hypothetical protein
MSDLLGRFSAQEIYQSVTPSPWLSFEQFQSKLRENPELFTELTQIFEELERLCVDLHSMQKQHYGDDGEDVQSSHPLKMYREYYFATLVGGAEGELRADGVLSYGNTDIDERLISIAKGRVPDTIAYFREKIRKFQAEHKSWVSFIANKSNKSKRTGFFSWGR